MRTREITAHVVSAVALGYVRWAGGYSSFELLQHLPPRLGVKHEPDVADLSFLERDPLRAGHGAHARVGDEVVKDRHVVAFNGCVLDVVARDDRAELS